MERTTKSLQLASVCLPSNPVEKTTMLTMSKPCGEKAMTSHLLHSLKLSRFCKQILGFLEKVFAFIGKESDFLLKDSAEKEIAASVTAVKNRLREAEKKKADKDTVKPIEKKLTKESVPMEVEKPKKDKPWNPWRWISLRRKRNQVPLFLTKATDLILRSTHGHRVKHGRGV